MMTLGLLLNHKVAIHGNDSTQTKVRKWIISSNQQPPTNSKMKQQISHHSQPLHPFTTKSKYIRFPIIIWSEIGTNTISPVQNSFRLGRHLSHPALIIVFLPHCPMQVSHNQHCLLDSRHCKNQFLFWLLALIHHKSWQRQRMRYWLVYCLRILLIPLLDLILVAILTDVIIITVQRQLLQHQIYEAWQVLGVLLTMSLLLSLATQLLTMRGVFN